MTEQNPTNTSDKAAQPTREDEERERVMRFLRFAGFVLVIIILWYAFDIASLG